MPSRYPLQELRRLLAPETVTRGTVVRLSGQSAAIATAKGLVTARAGGSLSVGATVTLSEGTAYPAARATAVYAL
jgi:hypothetical protein